MSDQGKRRPSTARTSQQAKGRPSTARVSEQGMGRPSTTRPSEQEPGGPLVVTATDNSRARVIEVLSILAIVATIIVIAVPKSADLERRATATQVLGDVELVRAAVYGFYSDSAYFPAEAPGTAVPESLVPYLPRGFSFARPYGTIEYRSWPVGSVKEGTAAARVIGATVITRDPRIGATATALAPGAAQFTVGNKFTFLFFGS